jgi:iron complex transport system substrate-binding protein
MDLKKLHTGSLYLLLCPLWMLSCIQHKDETNATLFFPEQEKVEVKYAGGFEVVYGRGYVSVITHSIAGNTFFSDTLYLQSAADAEIPEGATLLTPGMSSLVCQSSTHLAFLNVLDEIDKVTALCGLRYVQNKSISGILEQNGTIELCQAENVVMENLLKVNPDLFFIYPFGTEGNDEFRRNGVKTLYIAEYLEKDQLARLEWIKLFGLITGKAGIANAYFEKAEQSYLSLQQRPDTNLRFILNVPFEDSWFMPSAGSQTVKLIEDAGLKYYYSESGATENDVHSKEEVWNDAMFADYWIIIANRPEGFSRADLLAEEPVYAKFKSVIHHQVIFCNTATNDYFAQGTVEPEVMLKDLLFATHKMDQHEPKYFFLLE